MEEEIVPETYVIEQARSLMESDPSGAKAWILTAKTLFPKNFDVQFEAYKLEKSAKNLEEAARNFNYITLTFPHQNSELWNEVNELTTALRTPENEVTAEQEFYVKMFPYVSLDVQHKILLLTVNHMESSLSQCKLLLMLLRKFPQSTATHAPRLLEMIAEGMKHNTQKYQEMLLEEALPLIYHKTPEVQPSLVCRLFTTSLEHYIQQIIEEEATKYDSTATWKQIFKVLMLCAKILHWEKFLPFNRNWSQSIYWDKLIEIVPTSPAGSPQVLFYATTLFIYSLHCYIKSCTTRPDNSEMNHVLVEGITDWKLETAGTESMDPPQISLTTPISKEISKAFVNAAQCWQLLNTEQYQRDFSSLLLSLPLAAWISRFLFDLSIYFGHAEEAQKLMSEMTVKSKLVHHLQVVSLNLLQGNLTLHGFECIRKILTELPPSQGQFLDHLSLKVPRHMIFIPLTQRAIVQYCVKTLIYSMGRKLYEINCPDQILGDLLVLLQFEYPRETLMAEQIFSLIAARRSFTYRLFPKYIITIDFLEEFMYIWHTYNEDFVFDISPAELTSNGTGSGNGGHPRRSGSSRRSDLSAHDEFRKIIKHQIARANENITTLITNFITLEHLQLMHNIFGTIEPPFMPPPQ